MHILLIAGLDMHVYCIISNCPLYCYHFESQPTEYFSRKHHKNSMRAINSHAF